ncbi:MAG TPA: energy transducer TonB [Holophagaceae bacterium]|nr:energy transducer TonB [Holophagaceae bacterium]
MSLLVSFVTYGLIVLGVRHLVESSGKDPKRPPVVPTTQRVILVDFAHLRERPAEPAQAPKEGEAEAGGGGVPQISAPVPPDAPKMEPASVVFDETPSMLPAVAMAPSAGPAHGNPGTGGGTGGGHGTGHGTGAGDGSGEGFKAALPLSGEDLEVEERFKPDYPLLAELQHIEGWVHVRMEVNDRGIPTRVWIVDGDPIFHPNVISTFKRYRFKNLKAKGIPTPAIIEIPVWFHFPPRR